MVTEQTKAKMDIKQEEPKQRFGAFGWILLAVSAALFIWAVIWFVDASATQNDNEALRDTLEQAQADLLLVEDSGYNTETVKQMMFSAKKAGTAVADAINKAHKTEWDAYDAGKEPDWDAVRAALSDVPSYFPSSFENGASWYSARDPDTNDRTVWTFATTFSFTHNRIDCLWLCRRQSDKQIMAYATAEYDAANGTFIFNFANNHHITAYGSEWNKKLDNNYSQSVGGTSTNDTTGGAEE